MIKKSVFTDLPNELQELNIKETSLISWVIEVDAPRIILDYTRTEAAYPKHMYW